MVVAGFRRDDVLVQDRQVIGGVEPAGAVGLPKTIGEQEPLTDETDVTVLG